MFAAVDASRHAATPTDAEAPRLFFSYALMPPLRYAMLLPALDAIDDDRHYIDRDDMTPLDAAADAAMPPPLRYACAFHEARARKSLPRRA